MRTNRHTLTRSHGRGPRSARSDLVRVGRLPRWDGHEAEPRCPGCSHLAGPRFRSVPGGFATAPRGPAHGRGVAVGRPRRADRRRRPGVLVPRTGPRPDERRGPDDGGDRCRHARGLRSRHRGAALDASARGYRPGHPCHRFGVVRAARNGQGRCGRDDRPFACGSARCFRRGHLGDRHRAVPHHLGPTGRGHRSLPAVGGADRVHLDVPCARDRNTNLAPARPRHLGRHRRLGDPRRNREPPVPVRHPQGPSVGRGPC